MWCGVLLKGGWLGGRGWNVVEVVKGKGEGERVKGNVVDR